MILFRRVLLSACLLSFPVVATFAAPTWVKVVSKEVVVYSDANAKDALEIAVGYIGYRRAFEEVFAPATPLPPATMLIFRSLDGLHGHLTGGRVGSMITTTVSGEVEGRVLMALAVDGVRQTSLRQIYQFETIWALGRLGIRVPLWMSQGAGEVLESLRLKEGQVEFGAMGDYTYPARTMPWPEFFALTTTSSAYQSATSGFHEQAWGLMHRVLLGGDSPAKSFRGMADAVATSGSTTAVEQLLGTKPDGFTREILRHIRKAPRHRVAFDAKAVRQRLVTTTPTPLEVHVQLANLSLASGAADKAELQLAHALSFPGAFTAPLFLEARARSLLREHRNEDAIAMYRKAIEHGSTTALVYVRSAEHRLKGIGSHRMEAASGGVPAEEAVKELERALELDPENHAAYVQLGRALFLRKELSPSDVAKLDRGVQHEAFGSAVRYGRALLHLRLKQRTAMAEDLSRVLADPQCHRTTLRAAQDVMTNEVLTPLAQEVEQLATAGRFADARAAMAAFRHEGAAEVLQGTLTRLTLRLDEGEAWAAVQEARRAKDLPALAAAARSFIDKFPASPAAARAQRLLEAATQPKNDGEQPSRSQGAGDAHD